MEGRASVVGSRADEDPRFDRRHQKVDPDHPALRSPDACRRCLLPGCCLVALQFDAEVLHGAPSPGLVGEAPQKLLARHLPDRALRLAGDHPHGT